MPLSPKEINNLLLYANANNSLLITFYAGVPRSPDDESGKFKIFDHPGDPFSTYKFQYSNESFDKLHDLVEFNTLINIEVGVTRHSLHSA